MNASGASVGYTNPFSQTLTVPGLTGEVAIGYQMYHGTSEGIQTADITSAIIITQLGRQGPQFLLTVALQLPPSEPLEVILGMGVVDIIPEPSPLLLGLPGLVALLFCVRHVTPDLNAAERIGR